MARTFSGSSSVSFPAGAAPPNNCFTWVAVCRPTLVTSNRTMLAIGFTAPGGALRISAGALAAVVGGTSITPAVSIPVTTSDGWCLAAVTKPLSGSDPFRFHFYKYSTDTWVRQDSASTTGGSGAARNEVRIGDSTSGGEGFSGDIAVTALFDFALTDDQLASLPYSLSAWLSARPVVMHVLDQPATSQAVLDWTGGGANQASISGTSVASTSVPILGYGHPVLVAARQPAPAAPALSTLADDFDDNTVDTTKWPGNYGTVTETGGRARLTCDTSYNAYVSASTYTFDAFSVRAYPPAANGGTSNVYLAGYVRSAAQPAGTVVGFSIDAVAGTLSLINWVGFSDAGLVSLTYDSTAHAWLRVAASAGTLLWQTSPDGTTWTTRRSASVPAWLASASDVSILFESHRDNGTTNYAELDNFNVAPPVAGASPSGIAVGAAVGAASTALNRSAAPTGITAPAAVGTPTVATSVTAAPAGLAVAVTPQAPAVALGLSAAPAGIAVPVTLGQPSGPGVTPTPSGIAVPVAVGTPAAAVPSATPSGVAVAVLLGVPTVALNRSTAPAGVAVPVAVGAPAVVQPAAGPAGVGVAVAVGSPASAWSGSVAPAGVLVAVALGQPGTSAPLPRVTVRPNIGTTSRPFIGTTARP